MNGKAVRYVVEAAIFRAWIILCRLLPIDVASWMGGKLARTIGQWLSVSTIADRNLQLALPELSVEQRRQVIADMWENLGRVAAEMPHLSAISSDVFAKRVEIENPSIIDALGNDGMGGFFISGHFGNWELLARIAYERGIPLTLIYRPANNPQVEEMIVKCRGKYQTAFIPKGKEGARHILTALKEQRHIGMLVDQKMNDGIAVPFFGRDAMTAPAVAALALRHQVPVVPVRIVRTKGVYFKATACAPITIEPTGDNEQDILAFMTKINATLESWIREHPSQWFWVHKRWPKEG